jgi:hypothetical protein
VQGTRVLHFVGTSLFIAQAAAAAHARNPKLLLSGIISAYGCAWLGHFCVERNRPATFKYPLMSLFRWGLGYSLGACICIILHLQLDEPCSCQAYVGCTHTPA